MIENPECRELLKTYVNRLQKSWGLVEEQQTGRLIKKWDQIFDGLFDIHHKFEVLESLV